MLVPSLQQGLLRQWRHEIEIETSKFCCKYVKFSIMSGSNTIREIIGFSLHIILLNHYLEIVRDSLLIL